MIPDEKLHPGLSGIGLAMVLISFFVGVYYTMIGGWALFYLFNSFQTDLPWKSCPNTLQNISIGAESLEIAAPAPECANSDSTG